MLGGEAGIDNWGDRLSVEGIPSLLKLGQNLIDRDTHCCQDLGGIKDFLHSTLFFHPHIFLQYLLFTFASKRTSDYLVNNPSHNLYHGRPDILLSRRWRTHLEGILGQGCI